MALVGTRTNWFASHRKVEANGDVYGKGEWIDTGNDPVDSPTVRLLEMPPGAVLESHFHRNNQFQVFVQGSGWIGRHEILPYSVHYAGAFTGYGPLIASAEGLWYFTIRPVFEDGALYLATNRDKLLRGPKQSFSSDRIETLPLAALAALESAESVSHADDDTSGLIVHFERMPPCESFEAPPPSGSGGQVLMVIGGTLSHQGGHLGLWEHVFVRPSEDAYTCHAGSWGAELLFLQFPPLDKAYRLGFSAERSA